MEKCKQNGSVVSADLGHSGGWGGDKPVGCLKWVSVPLRYPHTRTNTLLLPATALVPQRRKETKIKINSIKQEKENLSWSLGITKQLA